MLESWNRIQQWLASNAPKILSNLQPSVNEEKFTELEVAIDEALSSEIKFLYSKSNGNNPSELTNFFYGMIFSTIDDAIARVEEAKLPGMDFVLNYADEGIKSEFIYSPKRIPKGDDSGTCFLCVDLDPSESGTKGQIILIDYDNEVGLKIANSLDELLNNFADDLEQGRYSLHKEALADGNEWLQPDTEIDIVNWFKTSKWKHINN